MRPRVRRTSMRRNSFRRDPLMLDKHRVVDVPEGHIDGAQIGVMPIRRELDTIRQTPRQIADKSMGRVSVACPDMPRRNELGISAKRRPRPDPRQGQTGQAFLAGGSSVSRTRRTKFHLPVGAARQIDEYAILILGAGIFRHQRAVSRWCSCSRPSPERWHV